jgi:hypothetical protein
LVYEFRIQQFDLIKPVETNVTKKLFKGAKTMSQRLCFTTMGGFRHVYCVKSLLVVVFLLELKQRVDFVLVSYKRSVQVFARRLYAVKQRVDYFLDYLK